MTDHWDEFSKSLAEPVPRRESLRRLGIALTATVLGPLGAQFARAGHHAPRQQDPCKAFCTCRNSKQKDQCLKVCKACNKDTSRIAGSCGNYVCCGAGRTSCGSYCADLAFDPDNCGACGNACEDPGPYEEGMCVYGQCEYACVAGAVYCDGTCTFLDSDPDNCGACGNVCGDASPYCNQGTCHSCPPGFSLCGGECVNLAADPDNCGACGNVCGGPNPSCSQGACSQGCVPSCPEGWCGGDGCGGACGCPSGMYCESNWCYDENPCPAGLTRCNGVCTNIDFDTLNCGACGVVCSGAENACIGGICQSPF
jgi:hypothetical protein